MKITKEQADKVIAALEDSRSQVVVYGQDYHPGLESVVLEDIDEALTIMRGLAEDAEPVTWQPIETAPKDGTQVILTNGVSVAQGNWLHSEPFIREHRDLEGRYIDQDESDGYDGWIDFIGGMMPEPTHWMPLPTPPESKG